jgi:predicted phage tail protein
MSGDFLSVKSGLRGTPEGVGTSTFAETQKTGSKTLAGLVPFHRDTCQPWTPKPACPSGDSAKLHGVDSAVSKQAGIGNFFSWMWNWLTGTEEPQKTADVVATDPTSTPAPSKTETGRRHPRLPSPETDEVSMENLISKMNRNMRKIEEMDEDAREFVKNNHHLSDAELLRQLFAGIEKQKSDHTDSLQLTSDKLLKEQEVKRDLHKKLHEVFKEQQEVAGQAVSAGWFGTVLTVGILVLSVLGIVAGVATGGASLGATIAIANVVALAGKGASTALQGYLQKKSNDFSSDLYGIRDSKHLSHKKIEACLVEFTDSHRAVNQNMHFHGQAIRNWSGASRYKY